MRGFDGPFAAEIGVDAGLVVQNSDFDAVLAGRLGASRGAKRKRGHEANRKRRDMMHQILPNHLSFGGGNIYGAGGLASGLSSGPRRATIERSSSAGRARRGGLLELVQHHHAHGAGSVKADRLGGATREIKRASPHKGAAVVDADHDCPAGRDIGHLDAGAERQAAVGRPQAAAVEMLAAGRARTQPLAAAIPACPHDASGRRRKRGALIAVGPNPCGLSAHLGIFRRGCAEPGRRPRRRGGQRRTRRAFRIVMMTMMTIRSAEVQMAYTGCIAMTPVMVIVVVPWVRLGKSAERQKRSNTNYRSPHFFLTPDFGVVD